MSSTHGGFFYMREYMEDRWLSVDEIAIYLGVSKDTIYTWVTSKAMPGHKIGRFWRFKQADVDAWVRTGGAAESSGHLVGVCCPEGLGERRRS
jgi:excisionase family DNA binding protein